MANVLHTTLHAWCTSSRVGVEALRLSLMVRTFAARRRMMNLVQISAIEDTVANTTPHMTCWGRRCRCGAAPRQLVRVFFGVVPSKALLERSQRRDPAAGYAP